MNPKISVVLDKLKINCTDVDKLIITHDNGSSRFALYSDKNSYKPEIKPDIEKYTDTEKLTDIARFCTDLDFTMGTDRKSLFIAHEKITFLRLFYPECYIQIETEENKQEFKFNDVLETKLRNTLEVVD